MSSPLAQSGPLARKSRLARRSGPALTARTASDRLAIAHQKDVATVAGGVSSVIVQAALGADPVAISTWFFGAVDAMMARIQAGYALNRRSAMDYLPRHGALNGVTVHPAPGSLDIGALRARLQITGPVAFKTAIGAGQDTDAALRSMATQMGGVADEAVRNGDRDVITGTALRGSGVVGWRRRITGTACGFCAMLASRGAVYTDRRTAVVAKDGMAFHPHDRCWAEPLYFHQQEPPEVQRLQRQWQRVTAGKSGKDAQRAWRRHWESRATPLARAREGIAVHPAAGTGVEGAGGLLSEETPDLTGARGFAADSAIREVQIENRIRDAYGGLPQGPGGWVSLSDLRPRLGGDLSAAEVDAALMRLSRQRGVRLDPFDSRVNAATGQRVTQRDLDARVMAGGPNGEPRHMISFGLEDHNIPPLTPLPKPAFEARLRGALAPATKVASPALPRTLAGLRAEAAKQSIRVPAELDAAALRQVLTDVAEGKSAQVAVDRALQAVKDTRRSLGAELGRVVEALTNDASDRALAHIGSTLIKVDGPLTAEGRRLVAPLAKALQSGDREAIARATAALERKVKLTRIEAPKGAQVIEGRTVITYDPRLHEAIGGASAGQKVYLLRPGYQSVIDGQKLTLAKASVQKVPADAIRKAEQAAQRAAARARAALIQSRASTARLLADVDELIAKGAEKRVILQRLDPKLLEAEQVYAGADAAIVRALRDAVDDPAKLRRTVTAAGTKAKIKPISKSGAKVKFDPDTMEPVAGDIAKGAQVTVVRRGSTLTLPDGKVIQLEKARVTPVPAKMDGFSIPLGGHRGRLHRPAAP